MKLTPSSDDGRAAAPVRRASERVDPEHPVRPWPSGGLDQTLHLWNDLCTLSYPDVWSDPTDPPLRPRPSRSLRPMVRLGPGCCGRAHGDVRTPVFMPVGTKGTVKSLDPVEVRELGAEILLGNTYHLHFRPGDELIRDLGGLHAFMAWDGPILTDSGGFQVFSLRDTIARVDDDGVTFRSVYDGRETRFTPELAARHPGQPGQRHRDVPRPGAGRRRLVAASSRRPFGARPSGPRASATLRGPKASCASGSARAGSTPSFGGARSRRSPSSTSTATRSAGSRSARSARRCSRRPTGRPRCCRRESRGTSWASATPKESSR